MLPVTNSYVFRESCLFKFCFMIICEERKQKVLILNSSEKFIMLLAEIGHVRFNMVSSNTGRKNGFTRVAKLQQMCSKYHICTILRKSKD